jgi:hypothetical protein
MIYVVNIKRYRPAAYLPAHSVYIGRAMPGRPGSPLGNPFKLRFEAEREEVLAKYKVWLEEKLLTDPTVRQEIERLVYLARDIDLVLECWCAPKVCHGDVVKRIVEERLGVK